MACVPFNLLNVLNALNDSQCSQSSTYRGSYRQADSVLSSVGRALIARWAIPSSQSRKPNTADQWNAAGIDRRYLPAQIRLTTGKEGKTLKASMRNPNHSIERLIADTLEIGRAHV